MWLYIRTWYYWLLILLTIELMRCEVLSENFVIRLKDMEKIIRDQKEVITNLTKVVEGTSLKNIVQDQKNLITNCSSSLEEMKGNQTMMGSELDILKNTTETLKERADRLETGKWIF